MDNLRMAEKIVVSDEAFDELERMLDRPLNLEQNTALRELLTRPTVFDK